jgi:hypothetical protein
MHPFTRKVMHPSHFRRASTMVDHTVAKLIPAEGPQNALVSFEGQGVFKKSLGFAAFRHALSLNPKRG